MFNVIKSNGKVLATLQDGTVNTTSASISLTGNTYPSWGTELMNSLVKMLENFADDTPPKNALTGQLWFNRNTNTLNVCPYDRAPATDWLALSTVNSSGDVSLGNVIISGDSRFSGNILSTNANSKLTFSKIESNGTATLAAVSAVSLDVTGQANFALITSNTITSGSTTTDGTIVGQWNFLGEAGANTVTVTGKVVADDFVFSDGSPVPSSLNAYGNSNVGTYLQTYTGNIGSSSNRVNTLTASTVVTPNLGAVGAAGNIHGVWTLSTGSKLEATYADLAERYASDEPYPPGTVIKFGGTREVTICDSDASSDVFGVVSTAPAYLMNATSGSMTSHVAVVMLGRAPVRVIGLVPKHARLVSAGDGLARAVRSDETVADSAIIGRSLESKTTTGIGKVEAVLAANVK